MKRQYRLLGAELLVSLLFLTVVLLMAATAFGQTTAIRAGNLIDPAAGTVAKRTDHPGQGRARSPRSDRM